MPKHALPTIHKPMRFNWGDTTPIERVGAHFYVGMLDDNGEEAVELQLTPRTADMLARALRRELHYYAKEQEDAA